MISGNKGTITLGGMVLALALSALTATPAHAGLTTIKPTKVQSTIDWAGESSGFKMIESTSTSSIDAHTLFASDSTATATTASTTATTQPQAQAPAEAPMPPAAISGSVLLIFSISAARVMKRKLSI